MFPNTNKLLGNKNREVVKIKNSLTYANFNEVKENVEKIKAIFEGDYIWPGEEDIYEFEKNYNIANPKMQIKILKKRLLKNTLTLFKNGERYINSSAFEYDPTFVVLKSLNDGIFHKLVVTVLKGNEVCKKYKLKQIRGGCALPENYKKMLLDGLVDLKTPNPKNDELLEKFFNYIKVGKPVVKPHVASAEELKEEIGSETTVRSDIPSESNYSETSEHVAGNLFNALIDLPSFEESFKTKRIKVENTICGDQGLKLLIEDKTPSKTGLLGGANPRVSVKNRGKKTNKRTKKQKKCHK
jgi:hypothetical protein